MIAISHPTSYITLWLTYLGMKASRIPFMVQFTKDPRLTTKNKRNRRPPVFPDKAVLGPTHFSC